MVFILIVCVVVFLIVLLNNRIAYSRNNILFISKMLKDAFPLPDDFPVYKVNNKYELNEVWNIIVDKIYMYDRARNILAVNVWEYYTIKYYAEDILKYGNFFQRRALRNFVKLIVHNKLVFILLLFCVFGIHYHMYRILKVLLNIFWLFLFQEYNLILLSFLLVLISLKLYQLNDYLI